MLEILKKSVKKKAKVVVTNEVKREASKTISKNKKLLKKSGDLLVTGFVVLYAIKAFDIFDTNTVTTNIKVEIYGDVYIH